MHPKVLSIVGPGRSGTTILGSILGETPGIFSAGELRWLWGRDLVQQRVCGCGTPPAACPVWRPVVEECLVAPAQQASRDLAAELERLASDQRELARAANRISLLRSPTTGVDTPAARRVTAATVHLVDALARVTGAHTVIDASKRPQEAAILAASPELDHYVVHMVRDPRAVVHSWGRAKPLPAMTGRTRMATRSRRKTLMRWVENATGAEILRRHVDPDRWLFLRYEDFVEHPRASVSRVLRFIGEGPSPAFASENVVNLNGNHNLSGNPNRFRTGPVTIAPDQEWVSAMSRRDKAWTEAATFPFLLRYGYPLRSGHGVSARRSAN